MKSNQSRLNSESIAQQLHSSLVYLLRSVRRADDGNELNAPRLSALSVVVFGGAITLGDLADAEQVRPPTMTRIVNALEAQGMVAKSKNEDDRRNIYISATVKGKRAMIAGRRRRIEALVHRIDRLSAPEQETLRSGIRVLDKMTHER
jgi:DNA-binding MarR family transcriptional regulator